MKISAIVITYNQEAYILKSLSSLEQQSVLPDELIIADDCSSDGTGEIIKSFIEVTKIPRIVFFSNTTNLGIVGNVNKALDSVTGEIVLIQAGDDFSEPGRIEKSVSFFKEKPEVAMLFSSYNIVDENGVYKKTVTRSGILKDVFSLIKKGSGIPPYGEALNLRRFPEKIVIPNDLKNEDDYLSFLAVLSGGIEIIEAVLYNFRVNTGVSAWMYSLTDKRTLISKFKVDIDNRLNNFKSWNILLESGHERKQQVIDRITLVEKIKLLNEISYLKRIETLLKYYSVSNPREKLILVFGFPSIYYIAKVKRVLLGLS